MTLASLIACAVFSAEVPWGRPIVNGDAELDDDKHAKLDSLVDVKMSCKLPPNSLKHQCGCIRSAAFLCIPHSAQWNHEECCIPQESL